MLNVLSTTELEATVNIIRCMYSKSMRVVNRIEEQEQNNEQFSMNIIHYLYIRFDFMKRCYTIFYLAIMSDKQ